MHACCFPSSDGTYIESIMQMYCIIICLYKHDCLINFVHACCFPSSDGTYIESIMQMYCIIICLYKHDCLINFVHHYTTIVDQNEIITV